MKGLKLHWQILIALALAIALGAVLYPMEAEHGLRSWVLGACSFVGEMFTRLLKMIVVPVIVPSIVCGMIGLGQDRHFGRLGLKTLGYYLCSGLVAILVGLMLVNAIQPGKVDAETAEALLAGQRSAEAEQFLERAQGHNLQSFADVIKRMIPTNPVAAATDHSQLLGVIVFCLFLGYGISRLNDERREAQQRFWESLLEAVLKVTDVIIRLSPYGVFALIVPVIAQTGYATMLPLAKFFVTVVLGLLLHMFVVLPLAMKAFGLSPLVHYRAVSPAMLTAFSTASSASTLPVTMECVADRAGVSRRVSGFTLPLGATMNMDGTALYECVVVVFIAQFYAASTGVALGFADQFLVVLLALLTSVGVAGIPQASLVAILVILQAVGLPQEAIALVLATDRVLDMCRTSVNVFSDTCGAAIVARSEGEQFQQLPDS